MGVWLLKNISENLSRLYVCVSYLSVNISAYNICTYQAHLDQTHALLWISYWYPKRHGCALDNKEAISPSKMTIHVSFLNDSFGIIWYETRSTWLINQIAFSYHIMTFLCTLQLMCDLAIPSTWILINVPCVIIVSS